MSVESDPRVWELLVSISRRVDRMREDIRDIKRVAASIEAAAGEWFAAIGNQHETLMSQLDRIDATIDRIEDRLSRWGGKPSGLAPVGSGPEAGARMIGAGSGPRRNERIGPSASTTETRERRTLERFLAWEENQPDRYELVYGRPRLLPGETAAHSQVKNNIVAFLRSTLQEEPWRVLGGDLRIPVPAIGSRWRERAQRVRRDQSPRMAAGSPMPPYA